MTLYKFGEMNLHNHLKYIEPPCPDAPLSQQCLDCPYSVSLFNRVLLHGSPYNVCLFTPLVAYTTAYHTVSARGRWIDS